MIPILISDGYVFMSPFWVVESIFLCARPKGEIRDSDVGKSHKIIISDAVDRAWIRMFELSGYLLHIQVEMFPL
jgi:hypothetical protein